MLKQWENVDADKLKRRIYKGIPIAIRGRIWSKILGLDKTREEQRGKYKVRLQLRRDVFESTLNPLRWCYDFRKCVI